MKQTRNNISSYNQIQNALHLQEYQMPISQITTKSQKNTTIINAIKNPHQKVPDNEIKILTRLRREASPQLQVPQSHFSGGHQSKVAHTKSSSTMAMGKLPLTTAVPWTTPTTLGLQHSTFPKPAKKNKPQKMRPKRWRGQQAILREWHKGEEEMREVRPLRERQREMGGCL